MLRSTPIAGKFSLRLRLGEANGLHGSARRPASMDLLGYSDARVDVCLAGKPRREVHDLVRQIYMYKAKIRVCPCVLETNDVWLWTVLQFLHPNYSNELTHPK
jgi:hypothetical protein